MKKIFLLIFNMLTFSSLISYSQNLVPNPSFEEFFACPDTFFTSPTGSNISATKHWYNPGGFSPDYFNPCDSISPYFGVPYNQYGFQNTKIGAAYAGIILSFLPDTNIREYIQVKLIDTLLTGKYYFVSFYASLADWSNYATNDIGAYFSVDSFITTSVGPLPNSPQITNKASNFLNDTMLWIEVSDTFIAQGGERYLTIGNFKDDANTDTMHMPWFPAWDNISYYYIDDVSVTCLNCNIGINQLINNSEFKFYPNPLTDYFIIDSPHSENLQLKFYNLLGDLILETISVNNKEIRINNIPSGFYILNISSQSNLFFTNLKLQKL